MPKRFQLPLWIPSFPLLPTFLLGAGLLTLLLAYRNNGKSEAQICELDRMMSGGYADCTPPDMTGWYILGGVLAGLGVLGFLFDELLQFNRPRPAQVSVQVPAQTPSAQLSQASALLERGAITAEEYDALKRKILGS